MKKIKLFPAPHLELRVHVSEEMEKDLKECETLLKEHDIGKECANCSWCEVEFEGARMCPIITTGMLEEKEWNDCLEALMDKYDREEGQDDDSM